MSETLSIENLPPSDRFRSSEANNAANSQVATTWTSVRQLHSGSTGEPIDLYKTYGGFKSNTIFNVNTLLAFTANAYNTSGGGILGTTGLYDAPLNVTNLAAASLTVGAPVLDSPTVTLPSGVIANLEEGRARLERASSVASSFRGRVAGPVRSLLALFDRWQISDAEGAVLLGAPAASFVSDLRSGMITFSSRDTQDRVRLIIGIYEGVHTLLKESDAERLWIKSPVPGLNNQSPLEVMKRGSISELLLVKSFVDHANGR